MADSTVPLGVAWSVPAAGGSPIWEIMVYG